MKQGGHKTMKALLLATIIWSLILYIKEKYFNIKIPQNDVDYIVDGVWIWFVPIGGLIYAGCTILLIKIARKILAKFK